MMHLTSQDVSAIYQVRNDFKKALESISTVGDLLAKHKNIISGKSLMTPDGGMKFRKVSSDANATLLRGEFKKGARNPSHCHKGVLEVVICCNQTGKIEISLDDGSGFKKVIKYKEVMVIADGVPHSTMALEDTVLVVVCVPEEGFYKEIGKIMRDGV